VHDRLSSEIAGGARPVLNNKWLTKPLRQPLTDQARFDVGPTAGRIPHNDVNRSRRIIERQCEAGDGWQSGSSRYEVQ
jgi:hypothetical protein